MTEITERQGSCELTHFYLFLYFNRAHIVLSKNRGVQLDQEKKNSKKNIILKHSEKYFFYLILWNPGLYM